MNKTMLFKRAEGIIETVTVISINVSGTDYYAFKSADGKARLVSTTNPRMSMIDLPDGDDSHE